MTKKLTLFSAIILVIVVIICAYLFATDVQVRSENIKTQQEEFYSPYYINDSMIHINITDQGCALIDATSDTLQITQNGLEIMCYDRETHKLMLAGHSSNTFTIGNKEFNDFIVKEFDLDTMLMYVPEQVVFKSNR